MRQAAESCLRATETCVMRDTKYDARPLGKPASRSSACSGSSKQKLERSGALAIYRELADLLAHSNGWRG